MLKPTIVASCSECKSPAHSTSECLHRCNIVPGWRSTRQFVYQDIMVMEHMRNINNSKKYPYRTAVRRRSEEETAVALCALGM